MLAAWWLYLVFLFGALEDACCPVIASCFSFYGTWRCLLPGDCILFFFLWQLRMLADRWLHLVFLSMALEDFSFYGNWGCLPPGDCILFFFLWHLRMLAAWWLHLAFLSMALEDACCLVIASCFSFYGTWRCLQPGDCILFFFLWHLKMLAAWLVYLAFLSMVLEDACRPMIASCFFFLLHLKMLAARWLHLAFLSIALEDACSLVIASCFSFYGTWRCLPPGNCILLFFLWHLRMLADRWLHLVFLSMALEDASLQILASTICFSLICWYLLIPNIIFIVKILIIADTFRSNLKFSYSSL